MNSPAVDVRDLRRSFGERVVLDGVDLALDQGRVVGLLGRNGAGKSTLMQCALGVLESEAGEARVYGERVDRLSDAVRERIGYVPQQHDLFDWLTPRQVLDYFKSMYPRWNDAKVDALLDRWSVPASIRVSQLSGGERQRLSVLRAIGHDPDLLVLDEPVAALDPQGRRDFLRELVERTLERETTVLFSTHIVSDIERVAGDVAILHQGRIRVRRAIDEVLESAYRIVAPAALCAQPVSGELARHGHDGEVVVLALLDEATLQQVRSHRECAVERMALEDFFIEVTR